MGQNEIPKTEYLKIRNYIVDMIYHANGESILIPSSRKLAVQFKVAEKTARKALALLNKENFTVTKKGIGTFSNLPKSDTPFRVTGILIASGKNLFHDYSAYFAPALVGLQLTKHYCSIREISLFGIDSLERIESEIRSMFIDSMLSVHPPKELNPMLEKFAAEGRPIITLFSSAKVRGYDFEFESTSRELGKIFSAENRSLCYYVDKTDREYLYDGMKKEFQEKHKNLDVKYFHSISELESALDQKIPDIIFCASIYYSAVLDLLEQKNIDYQEKCRLVTYALKVHDPRFTGIILMPPEEEISQNIADDLLAMMDGKKLPAKKILIPLSLKYIST